MNESEIISADDKYDLDWADPSEPYKRSCLHFHRAPENSHNDHLMGSLYREIGLAPLGNNDVTAENKSFVEKLKQSIPEGFPDRKSPSGIGHEQWREWVRNYLKLPENTTQRSILRLGPTIPEIACVSAVAKASRNWNPGELIRGMVFKGASSSKDREKLWKELAISLSVNRKADDVWAVFLSREMREWLPDRIRDEVNKPEDCLFKKDYKGTESPPVGVEFDFNFPAREFFESLPYILKLKECLTRKQWISILDSFLRISCVSEVLWTAEINVRVFDMAKRALSGEEFGEGEVAKELSKNYSLLAHGEHVENSLRAQCRAYARARIGLNFILHKMNSLGGVFREFFEDEKELNSPVRLAELFGKITDMRDQLNIQEVTTFISDVIDDKPKLTKLTGSGTWSVNLYYFCLYTLRQMLANDDSKRHLDQGYWAKKSGAYRGSSWNISLGANAVIAMVASCNPFTNRQVTLIDLQKKMAGFGVKVSVKDLSVGEVGKTMRALGLVVDSPDAEGGMVIKFPYGYKT